jgi:hypothetical protein
LTTLQSRIDGRGPVTIQAGPGTFSFIVPAHNDAAVLEQTVTRIADRLATEPGSEVLIVENGSTDDTWAVACELACRDWGKVAVRALRSEQGLAQACRAGGAEASGRFLVFTAADLPFGFSDIDGFVAAEPRPVLAIGSKAHPASVVDRSLYRRVMSGGFRALRWAILGPTARDPQGSLIVDADLARRLVPATEGGGFIFGTELVAMAAAEGVIARELPIVLHDERRASTVRPVHDSIGMVRSLVAVRRRLDAAADERARATAVVGTSPDPVLARLPGVRRTHPLALALLTGVAGVAGFAGAVSLLGQVLRVAVLQRTEQPGALALITATVVAVALLALAVWAIHRVGRRCLPGVDPPGWWTAPSPEPSGGCDRWRLAAAGAVIGAVVLALWRVLGDPAGTAVGGGDARYWYWLGWQLAEQVRGGDLFPGGIDTVLWPIGYSLRVADGFLPAMVVMGWNLLLRDPTLALNLATATAVATTALAGVRLARGLGASPFVAATGGLALTVAPALFVRLEGHYNLLFAFPAVLLVDLALRHVLRRSQPLPVARTAALLVLAYLSSGYFLLHGGLAVAVIVLAGALPRRRLLDTAARLAAAAAIAVVALSPFLVPKLQMERSEARLGAVPMALDGETFASDATSVVTPPDGTLLALPALERYNDRFGENILEATAFLGALPVLGLGALVLYRSPLRRPLLAAGAALWVASLGSTLIVAGDRLPSGVRWLPFSLLAEFPGFAGVRAPNRASFVLAVVAAAGAVVVVDWVWRRSDRPGRILALVGVAVLLAASVRIPANATPDVAGELGRALRAVDELPDPGVVLHLPDDCIDTAHRVEYQILHRQPLVGCQGFTSAIAWWSDLSPYAAATSWAALRCAPERIGPRPTGHPEDLAPSAAAAAELRRELGVGVVVFDRANRCPERSDLILDALLEVGQLIGGDERTLVIALPGSPATP